MSDPLQIRHATTYSADSKLTKTNHGWSTEAEEAVEEIEARRLQTENAFQLEIQHLQASAQLQVCSSSSPSACVARVRGMCVFMSLMFILTKTLLDTKNIVCNPTA